MSFLKKGLRKNIVDKRKKIEFHTKGFYKTVGLMNEVSEYIKNNITEEVTEDNINDIVKPILGRDIDNFEKLLILGKLSIDEK